MEAFVGDVLESINGNWWEITQIEETTKTETTKTRVVMAKLVRVGHPNDSVVELGELSEIVDPAGDSAYPWKFVEDAFTRWVTQVRREAGVE